MEWNLNVELAPPAPSCANHRGVAAKGSCVDCLKEICEVCTAVSLEQLCTPCAWARRDRRHRRNAALVSAGLMAVIALVVALVTRPGDRDAHAGQAPAPADSAASLKVPADLAALDAELQREPCDRQRTYKLVDGLYHGHEPRLAIQRADAFVQKCGAFTELLHITYAAHRDLSEWDPALADVSKLIEERPHDKDYGASVVVLSEALARSLSIDTSGWREAIVATAGGLRVVRRGTLEQVEVQGLRARQVPCAIAPELPGDVGLLGLSFLSRFDLRFDGTHGKITLAARAP